MKWWKFYLSDNRFEVRDKTVRSSERCYVGELEGANKFDSINVIHERELFAGQVIKIYQKRVNSTYEWVCLFVTYDIQSRI